MSVEEDELPVIVFSKIALIIALFVPMGLSIASTAADVHTRSRAILQTKGVQATQFAERLPGVKTRFASEEKVLALTLDLCGGRGPESFDQDFVNFLISKNIKTNIFVSGRWIRHHKMELMHLAKQDIFRIENHGFNHRPASSRPRQVYGIQSTNNLIELYDEIHRNKLLIKRITGRSPKFYRSGTAYYDQKAIKLAQAIGQQIAGFNVVSGDVVHPHSKHAIVSRLRKATAGSIIIMHLNHTSWQSFEAFREFYDDAKTNHFEFVHLEDFPLK